MGRRGRTALLLAAGFAATAACAEGSTADPTRQPFDPDDDDDGSTGQRATSTETTAGPTTAEVTTGVSDTVTIGSGPTDATSPATNGTSTSTASEAETTSPPEMQPAVGWWAHCTANAQCSDPLVCFMNAAGDDGFCTSTCMPAGSAASCGGTSNVGAPSCITIQASSVCALSCAITSCPDPMACVTDTVDSGPVEVCI